VIGEPTLADAILDRLVHNAHRIEMRGESMRKQRGDKKDRESLGMVRLAWIAPLPRQLSTWFHVGSRLNFSFKANVFSSMSDSGLESSIYHAKGNQMKKFTWTGVIVLLSAAAGFGQNPCTRSTPLTDQERFVRDEIQSRIDESIEAGEAKDLAAKMHYFAPDLTLKLVDGTVLDRKQIEERMKRDIDWTCR
jgi:IstB-like ATP binding protein